MDTDHYVVFIGVCDYYGASLSKACTTKPTQPNKVKYEIRHCGNPTPDIFVYKSTEIMYLPHVTCSFFPRGHSVVIIGAGKTRGFCSLNYVLFCRICWKKIQEKKPVKSAVGNVHKINILPIYYVSLLCTINNPKKSSLSFHLIFNIIISTSLKPPL